MRDVLSYIALSSMIALVPIAATAQSGPSDRPYLKQRCAQLLGYYAYYGIDRRENSDGVKNGVWVGASAECDKGRYEQGIADLERLMRDKNTPVPSAEAIRTPDGSVSPMPRAVATAP